MSEEERKKTLIYDDLLGEAMHVAFRKAADHPQAVRAWEAIRALPSDEWEQVILFVLNAVEVKNVITAERVVPAEGDDHEKQSPPSP